MTHRQDATLGRDIVARWCNFAERRLEYLSELFETGRWRRFHSEAAFLENIREAKAAVETWHHLLTYETDREQAAREQAARKNIAIDLSWPGHARAASRADAPRGGFRPSLQPAFEPDLSRTFASGFDPIPHDAPDSPPELAVMQDRYPLLRNAL